MAKIVDIEGVGGAYEAKLKKAGVPSVKSLLDRCATDAGRKQLAQVTGINEHLILQWTNHADLFRIKGVGSEYSDLLEAAGVDTIPELAQRKPENLLAKMAEMNKEKKIVRRLPVLSQVTNWVEQAKSLPRIITY